MTSFLSATGFRLRIGLLPPWQVALLAYLSIAAVFVFDLVTPQALDAAVMYSVPILIAGFSPDTRLTHRLVKITILADELGATSDAAFDGSWNLIGLENRFLSLIALAIVAILTLHVQKASARIGSLSEIEVQRRRHAAISQAADHIMASLGNGRLDAAIVSEAARVLEQPGVVWCPAGDLAPYWVLEDGRPQAKSRADIPPRIASAAETGAARSRPGTPDYSADTNRGTASLQDVLCVPIADKSGFMGVLVAEVDDPATSRGLLVIAASFANLVVASLQQSASSWTSRKTTDA